jgi:hypothetical protein
VLGLVALLCWLLGAFYRPTLLPPLLFSPLDGPGFQPLRPFTHEAPKKQEVPMLELRRFAYTHEGTFGRLYLDGSFVCYTVEREWNDNQAFTSCIQEGRYTVEPHTSPKYGPCLIVSGNDVTKTQKNGSRYAILFHPANTASQLAGCIAPGEKLGCLAGHWSVLNSVAATRKLMELVGDKPIGLQISYHHAGPRMLDGIDWEAELKELEAKA